MSFLFNKGSAANIGTKPASIKISSDLKTARPPKDTLGSTSSILPVIYFIVLNS